MPDNNVEKAKDFLWEYIDAYNKELIISMATTDSLKENKLKLENVSIGYSYKPQGRLCNV